MRVLLQRVHPVPVIRGWVREITASEPVARTERRVAERACALWAVLEASPGVLAMADVLVGAFKLYVATGAMETRASIFNTPQGLGIAVPALLEALRWRYPEKMSACRCWRLHWSEGASLPLLHALFAPLWRGGMVQACQGCTWLPGWDKFPPRRLILVEGYVPGVVSAGQWHIVGMNCRGHIFCLRLGELKSGKEKEQQQEEKEEPIPPLSVANVEKMEGAPHLPRWMSGQCKLLKELLGVWGRSGWLKTWRGWKGGRGEGGGAVDSDIVLTDPQDGGTPWDKFAWGIWVGMVRNQWEYGAKWGGSKKGVSGQQTESKGRGEGGGGVVAITQPGFYRGGGGFAPGGAVLQDIGKQP